MKVDDVKRLKELEVENARSKRIVADQSLEVQALKERLRDELLAFELFFCLTEARVVIEDWRLDYNHHRPHSALGTMTPAAFGAGYRT